MKFFASLFVACSLVTAQVPHQHHPPSSSGEYARALEDPSRDQWQMPHEVLMALHLKPPEAIADIVPSTDGPVAREAGVVYFIDRALATFDEDLREVYGEGIARVQEKRSALFPGSASVAALSSEQQIQLIHAIETDPKTADFFELLRTHTLYGFLGNPSYGGNRDRVGWKLIGFEDRMAYQPPFGYYDAHQNDEAQ